MSGYIKLYREINSWRYKHKPEYVALWIHILTNANFTPKEFENQTIPAGSLVIGLSKLAAEVGLSVAKVRTILRNLNGTELTIKTSNKFSIISISKWNEYQGVDKQTTNKTQSNDKQLTTIKEGKKERRENNTPLNPPKGKITKPDDVTDQVWKDFVEHRRKKKAVITATVLSRIRSEVEKVGWCMDDALAEMCARNWQGFKGEWVKKGEENAAISGNKPTRSDEIKLAQQRALAAMEAHG